jgi:hypothetical protein
VLAWVDNLEVVLVLDLVDRFEADREPDVEGVFIFAGCREAEDALLGGPADPEAYESVSLSNKASFRFENGFMGSSPISTSILAP